MARLADHSVEGWNALSPRRRAALIRKAGSEDAALEAWRFQKGRARTKAASPEVGPSTPADVLRWRSETRHVSGADLSHVLKHCSDHPSREDAENWIYYLPDGIWELTLTVESAYLGAWIQGRLSNEGRKSRRKGKWSGLSKARQAQLLRGGARIGWTRQMVARRYNAGWDLSDIDYGHGRERQGVAPREGVKRQWRPTGLTRETWTVCVAEDSEVWLEETTEEDRDEATRRRWAGMSKRVLGPKERKAAGLPVQMPPLRRKGRPV